MMRLRRPLTGLCAALALAWSAAPAAAVPIAWASVDYGGFTNTLHTAVLTSGASWTVPATWQATTHGSLGWANKIECLGAGQDGSTSAAPAPGGYGGSYAASTNIALTPNSSVTIAIGANGSVGGDTWFNGASCSGASVCAPGGESSTAAIGATVYAGGQVTCTSGYCAGGGAAGPNGAGGNVSNSTTGGTADNGTGGAGGAPSNPGGDGTEWGLGSGGGGGAGINLNYGGGGGYYGGGGGAAAAGLERGGFQGGCLVRWYS